MFTCLLTDNTKTFVGRYINVIFKSLHGLIHICRCCGHQIGLIYFIQYFQLVFLWNALDRPTRVFRGRFRCFPVCAMRTVYVTRATMRWTCLFGNLLLSYLICLGCWDHSGLNCTDLFVVQWHWWVNSPMVGSMLWTPNRFDIFYTILSIGFPLECFW